MMVRWACDLSAAPVVHFLIGLLPAPPGISGSDKISRSGVFTLDHGSGELCKRGVRVNLQDQPLQLLLLLLQHRGQVVTREEIRARPLAGYFRGFRPRTEQGRSEGPDCAWRFGRESPFYRNTAEARLPVPRPVEEETPGLPAAAVVESLAYPAPRPIPRRRLGMVVAAVPQPAQPSCWQSGSGSSPGGPDLEL